MSVKPCWKCGSIRWDCIDEHTVDCWDSASPGDTYSIPEAWMRCKDCGATWSEGGCEPEDDEVSENDDYEY